MTSKVSHQLSGIISLGQIQDGPLKRLVKKLRQAYPDALILFRADAGFAVPALYGYLKEQPELRYVIGFILDMLPLFMLPLLLSSFMVSQPFSAGWKLLEVMTADEASGFGAGRRWSQGT
jgi:hypothetical protein